MRRLLIIAAVVLFGIGAVLYSGGRVSEGVVMFLLSAAAVTLFTLLGMANNARHGRADKRARKAGLRGVATVLERRRNGRTSYDGDAYYDYTLSVELPGREPYVAIHESTGWGYLTVGRVTEVRVAVDDPQRIWIEYDPGFQARSRM